MNQNRQPAGTPEGGRFAEGVKAGPDTSVTLGDNDMTGRMSAQEAMAALTAKAEQLREEATRNEVTANKLLLATLVDEYELDDDDRVATMDWEEDPNADGTYDMSLTAVVDDDGHEIRQIEGEGYPVGRVTDEDTPTSDWDDFRDSNGNINVGAVREWANTELATIMSDQSGEDVPAPPDPAEGPDLVASMSDLTARADAAKKANNRMLLGRAAFDLRERHGVTGFSATRNRDGDGYYITLDNVATVTNPEGVSEMDDDAVFDTAWESLIGEDALTADMFDGSWSSTQFDTDQLVRDGLSARRELAINLGVDPDDVSTDGVVRP